MFNRCYLIPFIVCLSGILTGILFVTLYKEYENDNIIKNYDVKKQLYVNNLKLGININLGLLAVVETYVTLNYQYITRRDFNKIAKTILKDYVGIQVVGWSPKVPFNDRPKYEHEAQVFYNDSSIVFRGLEMGELHPSPPKDFYYPIYYLYPYESNTQALLLDFSSNSQRNNSLHAAAKTRNQSATATITLVQETDNQPGFLLYDPVYTPNGTFIGATYQGYRTGDVLAAILNKQDYFPMVIVMRDVTANEFIMSLHSANGQWIFDTDEEHLDDIRQTHADGVCYNIRVADRVWCFEFYTLEPIDIATLHWVTTLIAILTIIFTTIAYFTVKKMIHQYNQQLSITTLKHQTMFINYIFHEIRVPLNNVVVGVANISRYQRNCDTTQNTTAIVKNSLDQIRHILDDMLEFSKIENGKFVIDKKFTNINVMIDHIYESFTHSAKLNNLQFNKISTVEPNTIVKIDINRVTQCINNFLSNAFKYTDKGSVTLACALSSSGIQISVDDTGRGISQQDLAQLFQPYKRLNDNGAEVGTGLGLVICKQIINLHGGNITVKSKVNSGSIFTMQLPCEVVQTSHILRINSSNSTRFNVGHRNSLVNRELKVNLKDNLKDNIKTVDKPPELRILIVDDNVDNCKLLASYFEFDGHTADTAHDGLDALYKISTNKYDVVIMDRDMPKLDGIQTTTRLRQQNNNIPIVALTGAASNELKQEFLDAGANMLLTKPVMLSKIKEIYNLVI